MSDVQAIRDALQIFASAPEPFFRDNVEQFTVANQALNRIAEKLAAVDQVSRQLHGLIAK